MNTKYFLTVIISSFAFVNCAPPENDRNVDDDKRDSYSIVGMPSNELLCQACKVECTKKRTLAEDTLWEEVECMEGSEQDSLETCSETHERTGWEKITSDVHACMGRCFTTIPGCRTTDFPNRKNY